MTESLDFKKYFLDIDKIQRYPITFVIKSVEPVSDLLKKIRLNSVKTYSIESVVDNYMACIQEVINIPVLQERLKHAIKQDHLRNILEEIVLQSKIEYNYEEMDEPD